MYHGKDTSEQEYRGSVVTFLLRKFPGSILRLYVLFRSVYELGKTVL